MSDDGKLTAVAVVTEELTAADTEDSEFIAGSVHSVSGFCLAVTGDVGLICDVGCLLADTLGLCIDNFVAVMLPLLLLLVHKPQSSSNIRRYTCYFNTKNTHN